MNTNNYEIQLIFDSVIFKNMKAVFVFFGLCSSFCLGNAKCYAEKS